jgi:hypothetical protein
MRSGGGVPAAVVAGLILLLASCTMPGQQATQSPESSPSTSPATTPSTSPTPAESPTPDTSPTPATSPSPAKLIIKALPYHAGEIGVIYGAVTLVAAGGVKPYKWSIQGGALPPGLVLSTTGKTTGKPTTVGTFSFVVRVDDSGGAAAGAPSSILVFRQLLFSQTTATCGNSPSDCLPSGSGAVQVGYTGGSPGAKPAVKVTGVSQGSIRTPNVPGGCSTGAATTSSTSSPPPGMTVSASGGVMTLGAGADGVKYCQYSGFVTFVLVNPSPCGPGMLCTSSNKLTVHFSI